MDGDAAARARRWAATKSAATGATRREDARRATAREAPFAASAIAERALAVLDGSRSVAAGGGAGIIARTASAPLDRIKLLFQVQAMASSGTSATAYTSVGQAFRKIYAEEGILSFWKGNGVNVIRVAPYAAAQLASNDYYKSLLAGRTRQAWGTAAPFGGRFGGYDGNSHHAPVRHREVTLGATESWV